MNNDNELKNGLDSFLDNEPVKSVEAKSDEVLIPSKSGIVERLEKKLITEDGRQLITERYH